MTQDLDRRSALLAAKLRSLVRARWEGAEAGATEGGFPGGVHLFQPTTGQLWVLVEEDVEHRLGTALALRRRFAATETHVVVHEAPGADVLARRSQLFSEPPQVWETKGSGLVAPSPAAPAAEQIPSPEAELFRPVLEEAGLEVVVEDTTLVGELLGLELARVVTDEHGLRIQTGVGRFDREAGSMMYAELGASDALERVVEFARPHRTPGAERHPLNQLVVERWLRAMVVARPERVGAAELRPVPSAVPRKNLKEQGVATAVGTAVDGTPLVVTCSTGVDLDLVPSAADDRLAYAPDARLVLLTPARDLVAVTQELVAALVQPAELRAAPEDWPIETGAW